MLETKIGDIWTTKASHITIPVNTQGVMGAGLAKQFKDRFPDSFERYKVWCQTDPKPWGGLVQADQFVSNGSLQFTPIWVATKESWRLPSERHDIVRGLVNLRLVMEATGPYWTCALPLLGAGLGGLDPNWVREMAEAVLTSSYVKFELWLG